MPPNVSKFVILTAGLLIALYASKAYAEKEESYDVAMAQRQGAHQEAIAEQLNLTPEQQEQLKEERSAHRNTMKELYQASKEKRDELRAALEQEDVEGAEIERIADELKHLQAQTIDARIDGILTMREVLTPEQYKAFQETIKERRKQRFQRGSRKQDYDYDEREQTHERKFRR